MNQYHENQLTIQALRYFIQKRSRSFILRSEVAVILWCFRWCNPSLSCLCRLRFLIGFVPEYFSDSLDPNFVLGLVWRSQEVSFPALVLGVLGKSAHRVAEKEC